jgi:hypothetical protein
MLVGLGPNFALNTERSPNAVEMRYKYPPDALSSRTNTDMPADALSSRTNTSMLYLHVCVHPTQDVIQILERA